MSQGVRGEKDVVLHAGMIYPKMAERIPGDEMMMLMSTEVVQWQEWNAGRYSLVQHYGIRCERGQ